MKCVYKLGTHVEQQVQTSAVPLDIKEVRKLKPCDGLPPRSAIGTIA